MPEELKQAAQQALEALKSATSFMSKKARDQHPKTVARLERALTQRPAAQAGEVDVQQRLFQLLNGAAGDGLIINDIDAAELFTDLFPEHIEFITRGGVSPTQPAAQATPEPRPFAAPGRWFPVDVLGNPMREFEPGKWEAASWPSAATPEPVGEAGTMPGTSGFTMACFHADKVPVGTKLFTRPAPGVPEGFDINPGADGVLYVSNDRLGFTVLNDEEKSLSGRLLYSLAGALLAAAQAKGVDHA